MRILSLVTLSVALVVIATGCRTDQDEDFVVARSGVERALNPDVPASDATELTAGNLAFASDLYHVLAGAEDGNLFFSPSSISTALAMAYAGARGQTEREMVEALHFTLPQDCLHAAFNALERDLASRSTVKLPNDSKGDAPELHLANATWGEKDYRFLQSYLDTLARNYGAGLRLVDFRGDPEGARQTINRWVEQETRERIEDLIPQGAIDTLTRLVLTNAISFKASWATPFDERLTATGTFHRLDGNAMPATMMTVRGADARSARVGSFQALELPYIGEQVAMLLIVPDAGRFAEVEASLDGPRLQDMFDALSTASVTLTMPKFRFEWEESLVDPLKALGMPTAFGDDADFSGMDGTRNLVISDVLHKAFIAVDEQGTEAAAATAVIIRETSAPPPVELVVDRPFLFLIRDKESGAILFLGRLLSPE